MQCVLYVACLFAVVFSDSEPQREYKLFEQADQNLDGELTRAELDVIFYNFDTNHDKNITKTEFIEDWTHAYTLGAPKEAETLFGKADTNDDGVINQQDLSSIYSYFDVSGNNAVDLNEFLTRWGQLKLHPIYVIHVNGTTTAPATVAPTRGHPTTPQHH